MTKHRHGRATIISTALLLITGCLWEASYLNIECGNYRVRIALDQGRFCFGHLLSSDIAWPEGFRWNWELGPHCCRVGGFYGWYTEWAPDLHWGQAVRHLYIPIWMPFLLFSLLPARGVWLERRHAARVRQGLCARCGYDLRESRTACPECGVPTHDLRR